MILLGLATATHTASLPSMTTFYFLHPDRSRLVVIFVNSGLGIMRTIN